MSSLLGSIDIELCLTHWRQLHCCTGLRWQRMTHDHSHAGLQNIVSTLGRCGNLTAPQPIASFYRCTRWLHCTSPCPSENLQCWRRVILAAVLIVIVRFVAKLPMSSNPLQRWSGPRVVHLPIRPAADLFVYWYHFKQPRTRQKLGICGWNGPSHLWGSPWQTLGNPVTWLSMLGIAHDSWRWALIDRVYWDRASGLVIHLSDGWSRSVAE